MLIQTEKMSSLGQMVAGIAHEINTPLAYVKSSLASVKDRLPQVDGMVAECQKLLEMLERGDVPDEQLSTQFARVSDAARPSFRPSRRAIDLTQLYRRWTAWHRADFGDRPEPEELQPAGSQQAAALQSERRAREHAGHRAQSGQAQDACTGSCRTFRWWNARRRRSIRCSSIWSPTPRRPPMTPAARSRCRPAWPAGGTGAGGCLRQRPRHSREHPSPRSSIRSSPPRMSARARDWACPSPTRSCRSTAGASRCKSKVGQGTTFTVFLPIKAVQPQALAAA